MKTKEQVYKEIEEAIGRVPAFFKTLPGRTLDLDWQLFQIVQMGDSPIPQKYRQLMGLAISGATKCRYCAYFHTEFAKFFGATEEEIEDAAHFAKESVGWSTYVNGMQADFDQFEEDVQAVIKYIAGLHGRKMAA